MAAAKTALLPANKENDDADNDDVPSAKAEEEEKDNAERVAASLLPFGAQGLSLAPVLFFNIASTREERLYFHDTLCAAGKTTTSL